MNLSLGLYNVDQLAERFIARYYNLEMLIQKLDNHIDMR